jgi:hypothetical protein
VNDVTVVESAGSVTFASGTSTQVLPLATPTGGGGGDGGIGGYIISGLGGTPTPAPAQPGQTTQNSNALPTGTRSTGSTSQSPAFTGAASTFVHICDLHWGYCMGIFAVMFLL